MTLTFVELGYSRSGSLFPALRLAFFMAFIRAYLFFLVNFKIQLDKQVLIGFLQLFDVVLRVLQKIKPLFLRFFELKFEGVGI
jgi:hypothetical protein